MNVLELDSVATKTIVKIYQDSRCNICFGILYTRNFPHLFNYCIKLTRNKEDAYDIAAEAFMKASEKIHLLKREEYYKSWLFRIAHNLFLDEVRKKKKRPILSMEDSLDLAEDVTEVELKMERETLYQQVIILLEKIEPKNKDILVSKYLHNDSISEIKNNLGLTESAVKMRLARARKRVAALAIAS